ncbi:Uncharacterised protein [Nocardia farcinica]|uniref:hypothetical protein n=1 Tax=Nocardia farcinica TaxID=37329 RepID=UPI000E02A086|nr:hypothetical protein [Nocardia farcinica]SUE28816.1 Uncharacterised protein [Nocardia farcinica]
MADVDPVRVRAWELRVRIFGFALSTMIPTVIGCGLLSTQVAEWAGLGAVQRAAIGYALIAQVVAIAVSWRTPPAGASLVVVRTLFFSAFAALAVSAALLAREDDWELLTVPMACPR